MRTQEQVNEIVRLLLEEYPLADCTLDWRKDYELLFSVRLAAQCTGDVFNIPGSTVVDTHCIRLSNRLGLVDNLKDPVKIEMELRKILPPEHSSDFCHCIVLHGRAVCDARKPDCPNCCLRHLCQTYSG